MQIVERNIDELIPAGYNPRRLTEKQRADLTASLKKFDVVEPAVINTHKDRKGVIVGGHQRLKVAKELGWEKFPCVEVSLPRSKERELNIRLNKNTGEWDAEILMEEFGEMELEEYGFSGDDLIDIGFNSGSGEEENTNDPDSVPSVPEEPITKPGDLYRLGNHRLLCGDSTNVQHVETLMDGKKADMVFTDPPYGMNLNADFSDMSSKFKGSSGGNEYEQVKGDNDDFTPELINTVFACFDYCKEIFLWGADYYAELLNNKNEGSWIVWDKRLDESADKMYGSCFELCWSKARHKREIARIKWAGIFGMEKEHDKKRVHPTQKPTGLVEWFFDKWGKENDIVADLFGGSGSALIACEKTKRKCRMMELDPKYCDVIVKRWEEYTGKKAERL